MSKTFKQRIGAGEALAGSFVMAASATVVEMCGYAGFDFVVLDQEHGPSGPETLEHQIRAAETCGTAALVRVPWSARWLIQQALDAGAQGIVAPHVTTAEEAREIVRVAQYPPQGARGLATTARAGLHGNLTTDEHLARGLDRTTVILQIEDREALKNVAEIASVEGVDALFIGPADLSASLGHPGNPDHPDVVAAIEGIIADANGKTRIAAFARDVEDGALWRRERGVPVLVASTTFTFTRSLKELAKGMAAL